MESDLDQKTLDFVDEKILELRKITDDFIYIEHYSHTGEDMWKIKNQYTKYREETLVLCSLKEGILTALEMAFTEINKAR